MFRLLPAADVQAFIDADDRVQTNFFYQQRGLVRRTTGRGPDGWIVITLWGSEEDALAGAKAAEDDAAHAAFMSFVDPASIEVKRYFGREG
jgi:heme-degrading monooxygenase HmoA